MRTKRTSGAMYPYLKTLQVARHLVFLFGVPGRAISIDRAKGTGDCRYMGRLPRIWTDLEGTVFQGTNRDCREPQSPRQHISYFCNTKSTSFRTTRALSLKRCRVASYSLPAETLPPPPPPHLIVFLRCWRNPTHRSSPPGVCSGAVNR